MNLRRQRWAGHFPLISALALGTCFAAGNLCAGPLQTLAVKPPEPDFFYTRTAIDCTPRQTIAVTPGLTATIADSTFGTGSVDGYSCKQWTETGPEAFYALTIDSAVDFFAGLRDLGDVDLDLFLLSVCDNDSCLVGANIEFNIRLQPGTYTLVVDGYGQPTPQAGPFTLELSAREPGLPAEVCGGPDAVPVSCQTETATFEGDLAGLPDLVRSNDCSPVLAKAGEQWYAVTVGPYQEFTATVTNVPAGLDPVLWLFPACGPDVQCLDFADDKTAGQGETLTWSNADFPDTTVYLGVDAFLPPEIEGGGVFTLEIHCQAMVAAEKKPLGSLKALFR